VADAGTRCGRNIKQGANGRLIWLCWRLQLARLKGQDCHIFITSDTAKKMIR